METPVSTAPRRSQAPSPALGWCAITLALGMGISTSFALPSGAAPRAAAARSKPLPPPLPLPSAARSATELPSPLPPLLSQTGLFLPGTTTLAPTALVYSPQYPLWSDGAAKRRWLTIPAGAAIDASDPDNWVLPSGTRFWKELSFGRRVETRYLEKLPDGSFRFASYVWNDQQSDAVLAPEAGVPSAHPITRAALHDVPSRADCRVCHEGRRGLVLGFNALQLSPDRDPLAPHAEALPTGAVDLRSLVERGLVRGLPAELLATPPRIRASSATARAARGYLFGNCAGCHNQGGPLADVGLSFDQSVSASAAEATLGLLGPSRFRLPGATTSVRLAPGKPERSAIWFRMHSRDPIAQMPPLGTKLVDTAATALIHRWISGIPNP